MPCGPRSGRSAADRVQLGQVLGAEPEPGAGDVLPQGHMDEVLAARAAYDAQVG
ncbi:hypothetical protein [Modestobacter sp. SYSU DS0657]